jgi:hypothetical protein
MGVSISSICSAGSSGLVDVFQLFSRKFGDGRLDLFQLLSRKFGSATSVAVCLVNTSPLSQSLKVNHQPDSRKCQPINDRTAVEER